MLSAGNEWMQPVDERLPRDGLALVARAQSRIEQYFEDFEQLEGFSLLAGNLRRLQRKVAIELECVVRDVLGLVDERRERQHDFDTLREGMKHQRQVCERVARASMELMERVEADKAKHSRELQELHAFYNAKQQVMKRQIKARAERRYDRQLQAVQDEFDRKVELLELEGAQRLDAFKKQLERKKDNEVEFLRVELRLQARSQVERELRAMMEDSRHLKVPRR